MPSKQNPTTQPTATKLTVTPKSVTLTTKTSAIDNETVQFMPKPANRSFMKAVTLTQKLSTTVAAIDVQDDEEVVIVTEDDQLTLTEDEIGNLFQILPRGRTE